MMKALRTDLQVIVDGAQFLCVHQCIRLSSFSIRFPVLSLNNNSRLSCWFSGGSLFNVER